MKVQWVSGSVTVIFLSMVATMLSICVSLSLTVRIIRRSFRHLFSAKDCSIHIESNPYVRLEH